MTSDEISQKAISRRFLRSLTAFPGFNFAVYGAVSSDTASIDARPSGPKSIGERRSPFGSAMIFYRYFAVQGREALIETLASADPFGLSPAEVVERVLVLGFGPDVTKHAGEMWPTVGRVFEVRRGDQDFLVAISRDAEKISVQEIRADAYLPIE